MTIQEIQQKLQLYKKEEKRVFVSSSFQSHSIPLLHILASRDKSIPIYLLNTGYLFPETLKFADQIGDLLGMEIHQLRPSIPKSMQRDSVGRLLFTSDTDRCCHLNKVMPMDSLLVDFDVWISGVRSEQNMNRAGMKAEQMGKNSCLRFHPILDWTAKMIYDYRIEHNLPAHPLENEGYFSVGCEPCTAKIDLSGERAGRWFGQSKTECGLHTDLVEEKLG